MKLAIEKNDFINLVLFRDSLGFHGKKKLGIKKVFPAMSRSLFHNCITRYLGIGLSFILCLYKYLIVILYSC